MVDKVLYPNVPIGCPYNLLIKQHPDWAQYEILQLYFDRTTLHPVGNRIKGVDTSLSYLQGFWWAGFDGNETQPAFDALLRSREELRTNEGLWSNKKIINQYLELLTSKILCNQCNLRSPDKCQPLCLYKAGNPDLLVVPLVRNKLIPRIELPIIPR